MQCTRVLRRVTSGAFTYSSARSRARLSAFPFGTTSATTPHACAVRAASGLWVQQERLRSCWSSAITPRGQDAVTRHNAAGEVWHVVEGRTLGRHTGHELPACARQDDDLVRPILCNPVKGVDTLRMIVRREH